jgi:thioredoxin 1
LKPEDPIAKTPRRQPNLAEILSNPWRLGVLAIKTSPLSTLVTTANVFPEPESTVVHRSTIRKSHRESVELMAGANVLEINDLNFEAEVLKSTVPFLLDFSAVWCGPCKVLAPIVERLADEYKGKVRVGKLDIDDSPGVASKFGIRGVPTVLVFKNGEESGRHVGVTNKETLLKLVGLSSAVLPRV